MPENLTHSGSHLCTIEELLVIPEPEKTETYTPLNHYDFAVNVNTVALWPTWKASFRHRAFSWSHQEGTSGQEKLFRNHERGKSW